MFDAERDVRGLVFAEEEDFVAAGDARGAANDDPVLGAVVVHLQRQRGAGVDDDALDLEARAGIDAFVGTPGAIYAPVLLVFLALLFLQLRHDLFHVLRLVLGGDEHGVRRFHDQRVLEPECCDETMLRDHEAVVGVVQERVAQRYVAACVRRAHVPQRRPCSDIGPTGVERDHARAVGLFHHRVVDGVGGARVQRGLGEAQEIAVGARVGVGLLAGREHVGAMSLELVEPCAHPHQEHSAVPVVFAGFEITPGRRRIGLLDERGDRVVGAALDVAVAGLGARRRHAEGHEPAGARERDAFGDRTLKRARILDHVIRGHDEHEVVGRVRERQRRKRERGRGVAAHRFEDDGARRPAERAQLFRDEEPVFLVAHDDGRAGAVEAVDPVRRFLQHRAPAEQGQELLGVVFARQRPQARARSAGQDDRVKRHAARPSAPWRAFGRFPPTRIVVLMRRNRFKSHG